MRKEFDSKLDKMKNEFIATLDSKIRTLRDEFAMDMSRESGRIDQLEQTLQSMQTRLDTVERSQTSTADGNTSAENVNSGSHGNINQPEVCVTASSVPYEEGENLVEKATEIIRALGVF